MDYTVVLNSILIELEKVNAYTLALQDNPAMQLLLNALNWLFVAVVILLGVEIIRLIIRR